MRRLAAVGLSSALAAGVLVGVSAPPAAAAACVEGTDYTVESYSSGGSEFEVYVFTNTGALCSFDFPAGVSSYDYLVVGGGGGGGGGTGAATSGSAGAGGGGGGGQARTGTRSVTSLQIQVGGGGSGGPAGNRGSSGEASVINNSSGTALVRSEGGTRGSSFTSAGNTDCANSGSPLTNGWGGVGGPSKEANGVATKAAGYGYCIPTASYNSYGRLAAGGGGAGTGGSGLPAGVSSGPWLTGGWYDPNNRDVPHGVGGAGGVGFASTIRDGSTSVGYGGGGNGGNAVGPLTPEPANSFGGGEGGLYGAGTAGVANTGGGGGGGGVSNNSGSTNLLGGDGADGIVILSIELPKLLTVQTQPPASAASGVALSNPVVVRATDSGAVASGVSVTVGVTGTGCVSVSGTSSLTTDSSGLVTFSDLAVNAVDGSSCSLEFTATAYSTGTSNVISMSTGPLAGFAVTASGGSSAVGTQTAGVAFDVRVRAVDSGDNTVSSFTGGVVLTSSAFSGSQSATIASGGLVDGVSLTPTVAGASRVVSASGGGESTASASAQFTVDPGVVASMAVTQEPVAGVNGYSGEALGTQPVVALYDAYGNVATNDTSTQVDASLVQVSGSGAFSLGGDTDIATGAGVRAFTDLAVTGRATDTYRLDFSASGLSGVSSEVFQIAREPQSVPWVSGASGSKTFGDVPFTVQAVAKDASNADSGLPITFASSNEAVCTVSGAENPNPSSNTYSATVRITGAGGGSAASPADKCVVTASQAGDDDYAPATSTGLTFTVSQASQAALTITSPSPSVAVFGTDVTLRGTGGDGSGAYSWSKVSGSCEVSDAGDGTATLSPTGVAGSPCKVTFAKAADDNYLAATPLTQDVTINARDQVVSFTSLVPTAPKSFQTYTAEFSSSLGGSYVPSVSVTTGNGTICTATDNGDGTALVSFLAAGTCTLTATQGGDANTNAGSATQTIVVDSINQNITFNPIADQVFGVAPIQLAATASSGRPVTYTSSTTSVCTVGASSGLLTIRDKGTCTITVSRAADAQYAAANSITRSFTVAAALATAPHISSVSPGDTTITTSFVAPGFTGAPSEVIAGYEVTATPTSGSAITQPCSDTTAPLVCTMTGLANGTDYRITVAAVNSSGVGASSTASSLLRPATAANAVTGAYAVPDINGTSVHLYWDQLPNTVATLGGGTFTSYDVYVREVGGSWPGTPEFTTSTISTTDNDFTGLTTGQSYEFKIVAITSANSTALTGNTTIVTEYPSTVPGAVTELTLTETSDTSAIITWEVPITDGGATITAYDVTVPGLRNCSIDPTAPALDANRCVFTGMSLGTTYTFTVTATNRMGEGAPARVSMTTPPPPSADYDGPAITDQTVPSEVLTGEASWMVTENGRPVLSSLRPNNTNTGWIITGAGFDTEVIPLNAAKQPVGLGASDNLQVPQGGWIDVRGDDYRADSLVKAFLVPQTTATPQGRLAVRSTAGTLYLGSFEANNRGRINGQIYVPLYATAGNWVLQLVGQENISTLRTTNLALTIIDATPGTETFLTQRAGFFQGKKATLSAKGKRKLRALLAGVPESATIEAITITGVSVSKNTTQANLQLASQRADTIADYLENKGLTGTIDVTITTQITIGTPRAGATTPQPLQTKQGKPLTTTSITYQTPE